MSQLGEGFRRKEDREERGVRVVSSFLPLTSLFLWRQKRQSKVTTHSPVSVLSHSVAEVDSESCAPVSSLRLGNSLFLEEEEEEKEVEFFFFSVAPRFFRSNRIFCSPFLSHFSLDAFILVIKTTYRDSCLCLLASTARSEEQKSTATRRKRARREEGL